MDALEQSAAFGRSSSREGPPNAADYRDGLWMTVSLAARWELNELERMTRLELATSTVGRASRSALGTE